MIAEIKNTPAIAEVFLEDYTRLFFFAVFFAAFFTTFFFFAGIGIIIY